RRNHFVAIDPAMTVLEQSQGHVQAAGCRVQEVRMRQAGVALPRLFELNGLEADARPAALQAFANLRERFLDAESRREELNVLHGLGPLGANAIAQGGRSLPRGYGRQPC